MKNFFSLLFVFFARLILAQENPVSFEMSTKKINACEYDLIFKATIQSPWHVYSVVKFKGEGGPNATSFKFTKSTAYELVGNVKESTPIKEFDKVFEVNVAYHSKTATFTQRIKLLSGGKVTINGKYEFQACTEEKCIFPPADKFSFDVVGDAGCVSASAVNTNTDSATSNSVTSTSGDCNCDSAAIAKIYSSKGVNPTITPTPSNTVIDQAPTKEATANNDCNPWDTLLLGLIAGLGAVLMPCIYSLIPLTVSFFLKQSGSKSKGIRNAILYGLFIILIFDILTMGITIIFGPTALSNIATNTWLNIFFFLLFVVFALSFFGMFEITLPSSWANKLDAKADKGGVIGLFFMAATLVVVSFSCTAGFMGGLITAVAKGDSYLCPLAGFTGFGTGIALPFMLFAFFPSWLKNLPKSGGWMTTFKVVIAFIELALAVKFLSNADNVNDWGFIKREVFIAIWIGIFGMMSLYLIGAFRTSHDDPKSHLSIGRILFATISLGFTIYLIPGMWGAPLRMISSFPPPHHYAESPEGFGGSSHQEAVVSSGNPEIQALEQKRIVGPEGLKIFKDDYKSALKYAELVNKPLFVDFTGAACVNCRLMENNVWSKPQVLKYLKENVVIVSLYVDSDVELPANEVEKVFWFGKERELENYGDKWGYMQTTKYNSSSQPQYVILNHKEEIISNGTMGTELDVEKYANWIKTGVDKFGVGAIK